MFELLLFSALDHPSECGSRPDRDHRHVQKYPPMDDLQELSPVPATEKNNSYNLKKKKKKKYVFLVCKITALCTLCS